MKIDIVDNISLADYKILLESAGWKLLSDKQHQKALDNSMYLSTAIIDNKVVGFARLVGDNSTHGLLCDVVVLPDYQRKGIGKMLTSSIKEKVYNNLEENEQFLIELLPAAGKRDFYIACGFKYKPENMDGMYLWVKKLVKDVK